MVTAAIAFALVAPQTVTFTHACAHSSVVLATLGEELNLTLKPSGSVNKDYFLVRFKEIPVQQAFDKIAETLNATWTKQNDVYYLGRTRQQDNQDKAKDDEPLLRAHRMFVEKTLAPPAFTTQLANEMLRDRTERRTVGGTVVFSTFQGGPAGPGKRALDALVRSLSDSTLRSFKDGHRIELTASTIGQRTWNAVFADLAAEVSTLSAIAETYFSADGRPSPQASQWAARTDPADHMSLQADRQGSFMQYTFMYGSGDSWSNTAYMTYPSSPRIRRPNNSAWDDMRQPFERGPVAMAIRQYLIAKRASEGGEPLLPPKDVRQAMLAIHDEGLLGPLVGDAWMAVLKDKDLDGVVVLPDFALFFPLKRHDLQETVRDVVSLSASNLIVSVKDGFLSAVPISPYITRARRFDRPATVAFMRSVLAKRRVTLEDAARFAVSQPHPNALYVADYVAQVVMPMSADRSFRLYGMRRPELNVYGLLGGAQKRAVFEGGATVSLATAPKRLRQAISELFWNGSTKLNDTYDPDEDWRAMSIKTGNGQFLDLAVKDGIPINSSLQVVGARQMRLSPGQPLGTKYTVGTSPMSIPEYARRAAARSSYPGSVDYRKALLHQVARLELTLYIPEHGYATRSIVVDERKFDDTYVPLSSLPNNVKRALSAAGLEIEG